MSRYQFNEERLELTRTRATIKGLLRKALWFFLGSLGLAVVYYLLFGMFILSPAERNMVRETELMNSEYERLSKEMNDLDKVLGELETRDKSIYGTVMHSAPVDLSESETDISHYRNLLNTMSFGLAVHTDSILSGLEQKAATVTRALYLAGNTVYDNKDHLKYIPARFPLRSPSMEAIGATIGQRVHPFYKIPMEHNGMDFLVGFGTDVVATADGYVSKVSRSPRGQGNVVEIVHGESGFSTLYAHLSELFVRQGQQVTRGMVIARVGSSGMSFMPHLHYEVHQDSLVRDPVHYFFMDVMPKEYRQIMLTAYNTGQSLD